MEYLAFITDTHFGSGPTGFQQQPKRPDLLPACIDGLSCILHRYRCRMLLHGGDIVDTGSTEQITEAVRALASTQTPMLACLGNHDLGLPSSWKDWESQRGHMQLGDATIALQEADVIALNNQWAYENQMGYYWEHRAGYREALAAEQLLWLDQQLGAGDAKRPAILLVHVALDGLPTELTGQETVIHRPLQGYADAVREVLDRHPRCKLVLSGHNHVTCAAMENGRIHLSTSSLIEPPFEMRLISVDSNSLAVETLPVIPMPPDAEYLPEAAWVNGRPQDRTLCLNW